MLFDKDGVIKHYQSPEHIIEDFYSLRLEYYEKRRQSLIKVRDDNCVTILDCATFS